MWPVSSEEEQETLNFRVVGSIPTQATKKL